MVSQVLRCISLTNGIRYGCRAAAGRHGFERVSPLFVVIAIGVPSPPFRGHPLDPPLRSRFQCRKIDLLCNQVRIKTEDSLPCICDAIRCCVTLTCVLSVYPCSSVAHDATFFRSHFTKRVSCGCRDNATANHSICAAT